MLVHPSLFIYPRSPSFLLLIVVSPPSHVRSLIVALGLLHWGCCCPSVVLVAECFVRRQRVVDCCCRCHRLLLWWLSPRVSLGLSELWVVVVIVTACCLCGCRRLLWLPLSPLVIFVACCRFGDDSFGRYEGLIVDCYVRPLIYRCQHLLSLSPLVVAVAVAG